MRKYRGLTKDGKWVKGWYCKIGNCLHYIIPKTAFLMLYDDHPNKKDIQGFIEVIPKTVGQSTGLKDKNGKDLDWWEGDILKKDNGCLAEIVFDNGCFKGKWIGRPEILPLFRFEPYKQCPDWFEVIGNIHQELETK